MKSIKTLVREGLEIKKQMDELKGQLDIITVDLLPQLRDEAQDLKSHKVADNKGLVEYTRKTEVKLYKGAETEVKGLLSPGEFDRYFKTDVSAKGGELAKLLGLETVFNPKKQIWEITTVDGETNNKLLKSLSTEVKESLSFKPN